ncbi:hypothetical protein DFH09DRAFT_1360064 [Mycena vulgaris]|nr:hypothetical protein DFH09DRAFT_1360064 [Mycena vulgaris]
MRFALPLITATLFAVQATADIIAWSGNNCDGDEGGNAICGGECISFNTRHSFEVVSSVGHSVIVWTGGDCNGESFNFGFQSPGQCINVNTGTSILSLQCF